MPDTKGHESGHRPLGHPIDAFTWKEYTLALVDELGGWKDLAEALQERAEEDVPFETASVVKSLTRLAERENMPGNKYGKLLIKVFGLPPSINEWGRLMGQYHSRFADLPVGLRRQQLLRWDRPPVSESPAAMWVHIGLASLAHRERDLDEAQRRLLLESEVPRPEPDSHIEFLLLSARVASDLGEHDQESAAVDQAEALLAEQGVSSHDRACYHARLVDQRAYRISRPWRDDPGLLAQALYLYSSIPQAGVPPFAAWRRELGRAWCLWRGGSPGEAITAARRSCEHAGDGGFIRLRIMALNLMANIVGPGQEATEYQERAAAMAKRLEDEDLLHRLVRHRVSSRVL